MKHRNDVVLSTAVPRVGFHSKHSERFAQTHISRTQRCQSPDLKGERRFLFGPKQEIRSQFWKGN